jgi:hypothetical protein
MQSQLIKPNQIIQLKQHNLSIGKEISELAILRKSTNEPFDFKRIKKGTSLDSIKKQFKGNLTSNTHLFFAKLDQSDIEIIIEKLNRIKKPC